MDIEIIVIINCIIIDRKNILQLLLMLLFHVIHCEIFGDIT